MSRYVTTRGSFKVDGLADLVRTLEDMPKAIRQKALDKGTKEGAKVIQAAAIANAPHDTGKLRENIVVRKRKGTLFDAEHSVVIRKQGKASNARNAFYAFFLEYGTSKQPAKPFMRTAFEQNKEIAVSLLGGFIKEAVGSFRVKMGRS